MKTATKERPIIFSADMVRAILDGRKTQTRRVVKPQPKSPHLGYMAVEGGALQCGPDYPDGDDDFVRCPYGVPGDRLWVRETWDWVAGGSIISIQGGESQSKRIDQVIYRADGGNPVSCGWTSAAHMPRWASRITLEIVDVHVERVQYISELDAYSEGTSRPDGTRPPLDGTGLSNFYPYRELFQQLWDSLNAKRGLGWTLTRGYGS